MSSAYTLPSRRRVRPVESAPGRGSMLRLFSLAFAAPIVPRTLAGAVAALPKRSVPRPALAVLVTFIE